MIKFFGRKLLRSMVAGLTMLMIATLVPIRAEGEKAQRPNVILILSDDIGYSDIGCYGAEIDTPNLDQLGNGGLRFTQFYNMAKCDPTRASLYGGVYLPRQHGRNGVPFPELMRKSGYYTVMCGKEHFAGWAPESFRAENCYDDSFIYSAINSYFIPPKGEFENPFRLNGESLEIQDIRVNKQPFYKTDVITDYAIDFIDKAQQQNKPFLLYLPYHSAHYPLQAREEDIAKYRGKYKAGWDVIRQKRFERQKELGVIPKGCELSPPEGNINKYRGPFRDKIYEYRPWESLSEKEQDELDLEMAVFAAMIDCMDQNIGRIIGKLKDTEAFEDTLILYFSDNGSCPYDSNKNFRIPPGGPNSYRSLCAAWANVGNTPFRYYKQFGHEGGSRTHFIAHWPKVIKPGLCDAPSHLVDIYPTLIQVAGAEYPTTLKNQNSPKLDGHSLLRLFEGETRPEPQIIISGMEPFRMVRSGDWKIVKVNKGPWQLYNLVKDPTELNDLAGEQPDKVKELEEVYEEYLREGAKSKQ